jgi:HEAT repeat protein
VNAVVLFTLVACGPDTSQVVQGIHSDNPAVREDMVEFARKVEEPKVVGALMASLEDPSEAIRIKAVQSLAALGHKGATAPLVDRLVIETSPAVKREIIDALGRIADDRAVPALLLIAQDTPADDVPLNVVWALGNIGDRRALPVLSRLREESTDPYVVYNANVALRKVK